MATRHRESHFSLEVFIATSRLPVLQSMPLHYAKLIGLSRLFTEEEGGGGGGRQRREGG